MTDICEIRVYDPQLNWIGVCATAESVRFERELYGAGAFEIHVRPDKSGAVELATPGNFIIINGEPAWSGIIRSFSVIESRGQVEFAIWGESCAGILKQRVIVPPTQAQDVTALGWDKVTGSAEAVMKHYVSLQAVEPYEPARAFTLLRIGENQNRGQVFSWQARYSILLDELSDIGKYAGMGFAVTAHAGEKQLAFETVFGTDRSKNQDIVSPVSFNMEYQNLADYSYTEDYSNYRTTAYAGGDGKDENRPVITLDGDISGLLRFEAFIDCSNAKNTAELQALGRQKLSELAAAKNVEASALPKAYIFGQDYFLGDLVTLYISRLGLDISARVTSAVEVWERQSGHKTEIRFGEKLPNIFTTSLKKEVIL